MLRRGLTLGTEGFSFVAGAGRVGDSGGGLECRFSFKLDRDDPEIVELLDEFEETDRLVLRRSRIFMNARINRQNRFPKCRVLLQVSVDVGFQQCHARLRHAHPPTPTIVSLRSFAHKGNVVLSQVCTLCNVRSKPRVQIPGLPFVPSLLATNSPSLGFHNPCAPIDIN
jgi:hypothetical protein